MAKKIEIGEGPLANDPLWASLQNRICNGRFMKTEPSYRVEFSTRGRLTIPAPLRKAYGIKGGAKVAFEVTPTGALLLKPIGK